MSLIFLEVPNFPAFECLPNYNSSNCNKEKRNIHLIMAPSIMGTQLIWNARLRPSVSAMVPLSAQPRKALARVTLTTNPAKIPATPLTAY
jgi:hypothetical protein